MQWRSSWPVQQILSRFRCRWKEGGDSRESLSGMSVSLCLCLSGIVSVFLYLFLAICLSFYICLFVCLSDWFPFPLLVSVCPFICPTISLHLTSRSSASLSVCICVCVFVCLSRSSLFVCLSLCVYAFVCLSVHVSLSLYLFSMM